MVTSKNFPHGHPSNGGENFTKETDDNSNNAKPQSPDSKPPAYTGFIPVAALSTKGWLTREESARLLGVTIQTIKNYEKRRLLTPLAEPRVDSRGRKYTVLVHDPQELIKVKKTAPFAHPGQDTTAWWTREEAINTLNVASQTLKNYEKKGVLHPLTVKRPDKRGHEQGMVVYDPKELAKIPKAGYQLYSRDSGEIASKAFQMFEEGRNNREIVIKLRITPNEVCDLRDRWLDEGGHSLVINTAAKEVLEELLGEFADVTDLVTLITNRIKPA